MSRNKTYYPIRNWTCSCYSRNIQANRLLSAVLSKCEHIMLESGFRCLTIFILLLTFHSKMSCELSASKCVICCSDIANDSDVATIRRGHHHHYHHRFNVRFSALARVGRSPNMPLAEKARSCASSCFNFSFLMSYATHSFHDFLPLPLPLSPSTFNFLMHLKS